MKLFFSAILMLLFTNLYGQNGYVITMDDSIHSGYIKRITNFMDGKIQFEIWKTKRDKSPIRYEYDDVKEYALKKDTFIIVRNFTARAPYNSTNPFFRTDKHFESIEFKVEARGRLHLYSTQEIETSLTHSLSINSPTPTSNYSALKTYLIAKKVDDLKILHREKMEKTLRYYLDFDTLSKQVANSGFKYKHIPKLIQLYNSRH